MGSYGDIGESIGSGIKILFWWVLISTPLAIWKIVELIIDCFENGRELLARRYRLIEDDSIPRQRSGISRRGLRDELERGTLIDSDRGRKIERRDRRGFEDRPRELADANEQGLRREDRFVPHSRKVLKRRGISLETRERVDARAPR